MASLRRRRAGRSADRDPGPVACNTTLVGGGQVAAGSEKQGGAAVCAPACYPDLARQSGDRNSSAASAGQGTRLESRGAQEARSDLRLPPQASGTDALRRILEAR